jgi:hypothetical protein
MPRKLSGQSVNTRSDASCRHSLGLLIGALLFCAVERWLQSNDFLFRFRSVFAAGRAAGKVLYVEANRSEMLILGNGRVDNGLVPRKLREAFNLPLERDASARHRLVVASAALVERHGVCGLDARAGGVRWDHPEVHLL